MAELTPPMRGIPVFMNGGKVPSVHAELLKMIDGAPEKATIAVESPSGYIHEHARGAQLLETRGVADRIATIATMRGRGVVDMPAVEWRRHLTGRSNASNPLIKRACTLFVFGLPNQTGVGRKRLNAHVWDALGLAVIALRQFERARKL